MRHARRSRVSASPSRGGLASDECRERMRSSAAPRSVPPLGVAACAVARRRSAPLRTPGVRYHRPQSCGTPAHARTRLCTNHHAACDGTHKTYYIRTRPVREKDTRSTHPLTTVLVGTPSSKREHSLAHCFRMGLPTLQARHRALDSRTHTRIGSPHSHLGRKGGLAACAWLHAPAPRRSGSAVETLAVWRGGPQAAAQRATDFTVTL